MQKYAFEYSFIEKNKEQTMVIMIDAVSEDAAEYFANAQVRSTAFEKAGPPGIESIQMICSGRVN